MPNKNTIWKTSHSSRYLYLGTNLTSNLKSTNKEKKNETLSKDIKEYLNDMYISCSQTERPNHKDVNSPQMNL